jgi:hypothetical protein
MFLTLEQTDTLTLEQCEQALKILTKTYRLDRPLQEYMTPELWDNLDSIVDTLLYLEDRIRYIRMRDQLNANNPKLKNLDTEYNPEMDDPLIAI